MFRKLKREIYSCQDSVKLLELKMSNQDNKIEGLETYVSILQFELHNPAKFAVKDQIGQLLIIGSKVKENNTSHFVPEFLFLKPIKSFYWEYECFDKEKSEKVFLSEDELEKKGAKQ